MIVQAEKTLRVLHSAALLSPPSGILAQMEWEQEAANSLGINWRVRMYCPKNTANVAVVSHFDNAIDAAQIESPIGKFKAWVKLRRGYHRWLLKQQDQVDVFLLRYYVHDPFQLAFVKRCKKPVYLIHHTLEIPELALPGGTSGFVRAKLETLLGPPAIVKAEGVIGVTQEIVDYELARAKCLKKSAYVYPNGVIFEQLILDDRRSVDFPEMLFVANFSPWHGLDLLLSEVARSKDKFVLHLVGKIPESLLRFTEDSRIKVHGPLSQKQIQELSGQCWIGLASFALSRKQMKQACPLKVREYLMLGLPVYGDYQDVFPKDAPYFRCGDGSIEDIIKFSKKSRVLEKAAVANLAQSKINKISLIKDLYANLVRAERQ